VGSALALERPRAERRHDQENHALRRVRGRCQRPRQQPRQQPRRRPRRRLRAAPARAPRLRAPTQKVRQRRVEALPGLGPGKHCSPRRRMPFDVMKRGFRMRGDDVAVGRDGPGEYGSPSHRMPFNSRNEGSECVAKTWRATGLADITRHVTGQPVARHVIGWRLTQATRVQNAWR
jgi:hypothetical protein